MAYWNMSTSDRNDVTGQALAIGFGGAALFLVFGRATRCVLARKQLILLLSAISEHRSPLNQRA